VTNAPEIIVKMKRGKIVTHYNLRLSDLNDWHKYPRQVTESRLQDTVLLSRWAEIKASLAHRD